MCVNNVTDPTISVKKEKKRMEIKSIGGNMSKHKTSERGHPRLRLLANYMIDECNLAMKLTCIKTRVGQCIYD